MYVNKVYILVRDYIWWDVRYSTDQKCGPILNNFKHICPNITPFPSCYIVIQITQLLTSGIYTFQNSCTKCWPKHAKFHPRHGCLRHNLYGRLKLVNECFCFLDSVSKYVRMRWCRWRNYYEQYTCRKKHAICIFTIILLL